PDDSTSNYWWAQNMMAFLAAERCGYMNRNEAIARLKGMLDAIEPLERHHGFSYDFYDLATGRKTTDKIYFQGWWLFALCVLKNAYAELAPQCERLLAEVDYEGSGLFNAETRQLAADYWPEEQRTSFWIDLYYQPTGEFRTPYVAYTYLTGDISPWTRWAAPRLIDIMGHPVLGVWHNFVFCSMYVHCMFPDLGYLEKSWDELRAGLEQYRRRNGMIFYPTRAEPLEAWLDAGQPGEWPNTEHRLAKSWLAWLIRRDAPVMKKAFTPGYGVTLYYDNMNIYWNFGGRLTPCEHAVGAGPGGTSRDGAYLLPFRVGCAPAEHPAPNPPRLTSLKLAASCGAGALAPDSPLEIRLDGKTIATILPTELSAAPAFVRRRFSGLVLTNAESVIEIACADPESARSYTLYRYETDLWRAEHRCRTPAGEEQQAPARPPYVEITIDGQHEGTENAYALLARCAAVHDYYVWHEMLADERFLDTTVVWVGDYCNRARIGRVVHNVSDAPVTVRYERPADWSDRKAVAVTEITGEGQTVAPVAAEVRPREVRWRADGHKTYRVTCNPGEEQ
ncbi:MAG: hypothetical protein JXB04_03495, partial [Kiritimatiellae bacterium]|nr:hypothetical protein [Kiritimatiellia bacterium]